MIKIAPSILACDFSRLAEECKDVLAAGADWLHCDVMDGVFVPNLSLGVGELRSISRAVTAFYDVHLMIIDPIKYVDMFCDAGADSIIFHVEAQSDVLKTIHKIKERGRLAGLSVKPGTGADTLAEYIGLVDLVLVMTVEPGFGGQKFMPEMGAKISEIKEMAKQAGNGNLLIEVDGGIDEHTAPVVIEAGANVLVAGSSVFNSIDRKETIKKLRAAAKG